MAKISIGLIQASHEIEGSAPVEVHKEAAIQKHITLVREAAARGAKIIGLQEVFYGPYFAQNKRPNGMHPQSRFPKGRRPGFSGAGEGACCGPCFARVRSGGHCFYYNTAAVIDADGTYLGKYRKHHIPHVEAGEGTNGFGKSIISNLATSVIRYLIRLTPKWACISVMIAIFLKEHACLGWQGQRLF